MGNSPANEETKTWLAVGKWIVDHYASHEINANDIITSWERYIHSYFDSKSMQQQSEKQRAGY